GQLRIDLPFISAVQEQLPCAICREVDIQVTAHLIRNVQKQRGEVVGEAGLRAAVQSCLTSGKVPRSARSEGLLLKQIIADTNKVPAELKRVIAYGLGPVVHDVEVCFGADPRHTGGVTEQWIRKAGTVEGGHTASKRADIHTRDAEGRGTVGAIVGADSFIAVTI